MSSKDNHDSMIIVFPNGEMTTRKIGHHLCGIINKEHSRPSEIYIPVSYLKNIGVTALTTVRFQEYLYQTLLPSIQDNAPYLCYDCPHKAACVAEYGDEHEAVIGTHHCRRSWDKHHKTTDTLI